MIGRSNRLSPAKGILIGLALGVAFWATLAAVVSVAHDHASRGELLTLAREVTR